MRQATTLDWRSKGLNADDGKAIACLISSGALASLQTLWLNHNQIGDAGMIAFAEALKPNSNFPMGALASLKELYIGGNQIGDSGMKAFSAVLSSGALDTLTYLYLYNNPASNSAKDTMKAVASNRSISLSI